MSDHVCPWWLGYLLASPIRKLWQDPGEILAPYVRPGMSILEIGPGVGFFSIPLARMAENTGHVICVDLQEKMLKTLRRKAAKAGVATSIETRVCSKQSLCISDLGGKIDFALAFAVVHEIPDAEALFMQIYQSLKKGGLLLFSEPIMHVSKASFAENTSRAEKCGFQINGNPVIKSTLSAVLKK